MLNRGGENLKLPGSRLHWLQHLFVHGVLSGSYTFPGLSKGRRAITGKSVAGERAKRQSLGSASHGMPKAVLPSNSSVSSLSNGW